MKRELILCKEHLVQLKDTPKIGVLTWLTQKAKNDQHKYLLAFCDEGVIWGYVRDHQIVFPNERSRQPLFQEITLQEVRLFGEKGELYLWKTEDGFSARSIQLTSAGQSTSWTYQHDEGYYLWGTEGEDIGNGFTYLKEGAQGMRHAVPFKTNNPKNLKLIVRHFLIQEDFEPLRVVTSRLVGFSENE